jgi:imidazolonepropionase-like amidohydrolase
VTRILLTGGRVFDGTGADFVTADVALEGSNIVAVGAGLDGDVEVAIDGATVLPGLIDAHVHVCLGTIDLMKNLNLPFSYQFYVAEQNLKKTLDLGHQADLTIVDGDPLDFRAYPGNVRHVYRRGARVRG